MTSRTFTVTAIPATAPPTGTPSWFNNLAHKQWTKVCTGDQSLQPFQRGPTIRNVYDANLADWGVVSGVMAANPHGSINTLVSSESGLCVDHVRGEILPTAMGGHNDFYANDGYACNLRDEVPGYILLNRRTPVYSPTALYVGTLTTVTDDQVAPSGKRCTLATVSATGLPPGPYGPSNNSAPYRLAWRPGAKLAGGHSCKVEYYENVGGVGRFYLMDHNLPSSARQGQNDYRMLNLPNAGDPFAMTQSFIDEAYNSGSGTIPGLYGDGRPRAMHCVNDPHFRNGRIWWAKQNSLASAAGQSAFGIVSFNRDACRGQEPLPWSPTVLTPWTVHGNVPVTTTNTNLIFQPSALDEQTGLIWHMSQSLNVFWSIDTNAPAAPNLNCAYYTVSAAAGGPFFQGTKSMWAVCIPGADPSGDGSSIIVVGQSALNFPGSHGVFVFRPKHANPANLTSATSDSFGSVRMPIKQVSGAEQFDWRYGIISQGGTGGFSDEWGAVWHPEDKSILLWCADAGGGGTAQTSPPGTVRRIRPPMNGNVYNPNGTWTCDEIQMTSGTPPPAVFTGGPADQQANTFSKFNMLRDFGGPGIHALVIVWGTGQPTYVCRLSGAM